MNKEWSEKNKEIKKLLCKEATYKDGISKLIEFREELFTQITYIVDKYPVNAFAEMPFPKVNGYHSKTLAYSIWHIFRIEDIVCHEMISDDEQILFSEKYYEKIGSNIITTGNELVEDEIVEFSKKLDINELYCYAQSVKSATDEVLKKLEFTDIKKKFTVEMNKKIEETNCVSKDENAVWLIDYWCKKDIRGLIGMPFSRHWIMHIEAMHRIKSKLCIL